MGIDDATLDRWVQEDPTWQKPFFGRVGQAISPVARALAPLRDRVVRPGELLMALLAPPERGEEIEAELGAPLLGLWHRAEDLSSRGMSFYAVVAELAACCEEKRRSRDVPPPRNQGQLSVLTLHGSKGLEFPHVILIDLGKKGRAPAMPLLFWDREKGAYLSPRDEDGERDKKNPVEIEWRAGEKSKALAESKRVFYVALTRAQERLVLVCPEIEDYEASDPGEAYLEDDWRGWVECAPGEVTRLEGLGPVAARAPGDAAADATTASADRDHATGSRVFAPSMTAVPTRPRHSVTEWNLLSRCERAYEWTYVRPVTAPVEGDLFAQAPRSRSTAAADAANGDDDGAISSRELGTRVHACLEKGDIEALRALEREAGSERFQAEPLIEWARTSPLMRPASPFEGPAEAAREVWAELAFEAPIEVGERRPPAVLVGSLDRLVHERGSDAKVRAGQYAIIDFKVTEAPKSPAQLIDAYGTQMELYARGLRQLATEAQPEIRAVLVNISAGAVSEVEVPLGKLDTGAIAKAAVDIVAGRAGRPSPGELCRYCDFRAICPDARAPGKRRG
jgi:ATP-dependent exoDNAse (exonuclease V) beta subunit